MSMLRALRRLIPAVLLPVFVLLCVCPARSQETAPAASGMTKATLTLQWYPQTQFAGYYMARAFTQRAVSTSEIRRGGSDVDTIGELREGRRTLRRSS